MEPRPGAPEDVTVEPAPRRSSRATSPLRQVGYAAVLVALAFSQAGGRMVADTKFDLLTNPIAFLTRGLHLWDAQAAFGQLQNQAYGYAWPMGPFFAAGHLAHVPEWAVQRAWWALLMCLAFFGVLRLAQRLAIGTPLTQVVAAFAFVLTPRISTLLGSASAEVWPMALAPWVLLPLIRGSQRGSVRRAAAASALVVACCGGVNAVAVAAVLPLGVIWIVTQARGPRRWRLLGWWTGFTVLATVWWAGPLLLLGKYSAPFLDYIENATITTVPTDLARSMAGVSNWVAYFAGFDYPAGRQIVSTPFMLLDASAIVALGLLGLCLRGLPHQRFLVLSAVVGAALVGLGYAGDLHGFFASDRLRLLDQSLAPLRNLHKFDVVLRVPLVLGVAHSLSRLPAMLEGAGSLVARRVLAGATVLVLVGLALPWVNANIAPERGVLRVPAYWTSAAAYLEDHGSATTALELPASNFGVYTWGNVHDDILQGLASSPWAVRNVIPLAQPGNVVMLDKITRAVESGHPGPQLASFLARNGVGHLVVRNDLDRFQTGSPDPAYVRSALKSVPGLTLARSFGPKVGEPTWRRAANGVTRLVTGSGLSEQVASIDVYDVESPDEATLTSGAHSLVGDPGSDLDGALAFKEVVPRVLAADVPDSDKAVTGQVLTDDLRRREKNFASTRWNESATMGANDGYRLSGREHAHRVVSDDRRWNTTQIWTGGVVGAFASSSEAFADAIPPLSIGQHPGAALDRDRSTEWASARHLDAHGQWWQMDFDEPRVVNQVFLRMGRDSVKVDKLRLSIGGKSVLVNAPDPGEARTYDLDLPAGRALRVTAAGRDLRLPGSFTLTGVRVDDLLPQRVLSLPAPDANGPVDVVALSRDPERRACVEVDEAVTCTPALTAPGEDGDTLARLLRVSTSDEYDVKATVSLRRRSSAGTQLLRQMDTVLRAPTPPGRDVATAPVAMVDGEQATTWTANDAFPVLSLVLPRAERLRTISMTVNDAAPASRPTRLLVAAGTRRAVVPLDANGTGVLPGWTARRLNLTVLTTERAFRVDGTDFVEARAGVTELLINGASPTRTEDGDVVFPCGAGPTLQIGNKRLRTEVRATPAELVRGAAVPARLCNADTVGLDSSPTKVLATPTRALRVDSVTLTRVGAQAQSVQSLRVTRDHNGVPSSVAVGAREQSALLTLPQNFNAGWTARLHGKEVPAQRVDGWKQGWILPAGEAGTVRLDYSPGHLFAVLLGVGAAGVLVVALCALPLHRRRRRTSEPAPLRPGRPGVPDLVVVGLAGGLLAGWLGMAGALVAVTAGLLVRQRAVWGPLSATAFLAAGLGLTWHVLVDRDWAVTWTQSWSLLALAALVAALASGRRDDEPSAEPDE